MQRAEIEQKTTALEAVGTQQQKEYEETVISYQKKIKDFIDIFGNHEFASHAFSFMQDQTMPNVWFSRFDLDKKNSKVQLLGQADNMEDFSRQVANFEKNEYVKSVGTLNSALSESAKVQFNVNLVLDSKLFSYVPDILPNISDVNSASLSGATVTGSSENIFQTASQEAKKMITVFDLFLSPEVIGRVDQNSHTIKLDVPYGTDVSGLIPLIIISPEAVVSPESYVAQDFTRPVTYRVTAKDGSIQNYTVTVNILPQEGQQKSNSGYSILMAFGLISVVVLVVLGIFSIFKKKLKKKSNEN